ncbi:hypothetical protein [Levilactobacillus enshiensis]|uniref:hypothetical protein n=1 Tax=Levilactobacillus enshiensis TaxID=2590213 RepID=UPI00117A0C83|nr:hypothetical protein [Levilactobacillus enshiensis]
MAPAVKVKLAGVSQPAYFTGAFGDTRSSWLQSEREDWYSSSLKRPHSRWNPWQPECAHYTPE